MLGFMPEGDTVWHAARLLHGTLAGRELTRSDFRVPRYALADLSGHTVTEVVPRGKHLLIRMGNGLTVHTHLKMEGRWRIAPVSERLRESYRIRLVLENAEWRATGYQLGIVEIVRTAREDRITGHLGPDLLGPDWDPGEAVRRLREDPDRAAGEALLDQRNLAGIGNVYKSEVLFLRGIRPTRPVGKINDLDALVSLAQRMLDFNKDRYDRVTTGDQRRGHETWVYGRRDLPCRRCGTRIRHAEFGDRITYWCPSCQPD
jgi:endonuclease VIII